MVKLCRIVNYIKQVMNVPLFLAFTHILHIIDMFPDLTKTCIVFNSLMDTFQARFFKLCIVITLLGVYLFHKLQIVV